MRLVAPEDWLSSVVAARADGYRFFDWLGAEDLIGRQDALLVVLALRRLDRPADVLLLGTELNREAPELDSIRSVYAGAAWHEREAAELFGIEFSGGQPGRLLLAAGFTGTPLRRDEVLAARTGLAWPGAKEPGESDLRPEPLEGRASTGSPHSGASTSSPQMRPEPLEGRASTGSAHRGASTGSAPKPRRRLVPPGVPDPAVWGDRDPAVPDPTASEVADSTAGGRQRRRP
ncbi:MAG TPA: NADH-quinone oxidoreductase subunit C [Propionibacteriaceae bacterium]|nr:NADH-quinone oxidoreductase subunit C [Propionibacteriaceae bacterium]